MDASTRSQPRIVVGVDGSEPSRDALEWATQQAELDGKLDVVMTWELPTSYGWATSYPEASTQRRTRGGCWTKWWPLCSLSTRVSRFKPR